MLVHCTHLLMRLQTSTYIYIYIFFQIWQPIQRRRRIIVYGTDNHGLSGGVAQEACPKGRNALQGKDVHPLTIGSSIDVGRLEKHKKRERAERGLTYSLMVRLRLCCLGTPALLTAHPHLPMSVFGHWK